MNSHQRYIQYRKDELYHYNHNHDPRDGRFTSGKGIRAALNKAKKAFHEWDEKPRDPDVISPYHEMDGRFTPDPSKTRVISPGDRGGLQEYMLEYVPDKGLLESKDKYKKRIDGVETALYKQYVDTTSIKDSKTKTSVEEKIFKEASQVDSGNASDDVHNSLVAAAIWRRVMDGSVDLYNGIAKSNTMKPVLKEYEDHYRNNRPSVLDKEYSAWRKSEEFVTWKKREEQLMKKMAKQALADSGYEDTAAGEEFLIEMWRSL